MGGESGNEGKAHKSNMSPGSCVSPHKALMRTCEGEEKVSLVSTRRQEEGVSLVSAESPHKISESLQTGEGGDSDTSGEATDDS